MSTEALLRQLAEPAPYAALMLAMVVLVVTLERWRPAALGATSGLRRWSIHGGLMLINSLLGSQLGPALIVLIVAWKIPVNHFLMNRYDEYPITVIAVSVLALDLAAYWLHRFMHRDLPWRAHRLHHSDRGYDVSTSLRFHPLEGALAMIWRLVWVIALGVPLLALAVHSLLALLFNTIAHANLRLPPAWSRALGTVFVTPDLHRIHHSLDGGDSRHNYATIFSIWDRLFGTYRPYSLKYERAPVTGVRGVGADQIRTLWHALRLPFKDLSTPVTLRSGAAISPLHRAARLPISSGVRRHEGPRSVPDVAASARGRRSGTGRRRRLN